MSPQLPEMYRKAMQSHEQTSSSLPTDPLDRIHALISTAEALQEDWERRQQVHLAELDRLKQEIEDWQNREKIQLAEVERLEEELETANRNYSLLSASSQDKEKDLHLKLLTQKKLFIDQDLEQKDVESLRQQLNKAEETIVKLNEELEMAQKQEETKEQRKSDEDKSKMKAPLPKGNESRVVAKSDKDERTDSKVAEILLLVSTSPPSSFSDLLRLEYSKLKLKVFQDPSRILKKDEVEELWEVMKDKERNMFTMAWLLGWELVEEPQHLLYLAGSPPMRVAALYCQLIELDGNLPIESISENVILRSTIFEDNAKEQLRPCFEKAKIQLLETKAYVLKQIPMIFSRLRDLCVKRRFDEAGLAGVLEDGLTHLEKVRVSIFPPKFSASEFRLRNRIVITSMWYLDMMGI